eukprot:2052597-Rhodomonas_salina.1
MPDLVESGLLHGDVDAAPVDVVVRRTVVHDVPVLGAAACELAGVDEDGVVGRDDGAFAVLDDLVARVLEVEVVQAPAVRQEVPHDEARRLGGASQQRAPGRAELRNVLHELVSLELDKVGLVLLGQLLA